MAKALIMHRGMASQTVTQPRRASAPQRTRRLTALFAAVCGALVLTLALPVAASARRDDGSYLVIPGEAIGPIKVGESQANAVAALGPEEVVNGYPGNHFYPSWELLVSFIGGRVAGIQASETLPRAGLATHYHTKKFRIGQDYTAFQHAYHQARCVARELSTTEGTPTKDVVITCRLAAPGGNYTLFGFLSHDNGTPICDAITVGTR